MTGSQLLAYHLITFAGFVVFEHNPNPQVSYILSFLEVFSDCEAVYLHLSPIFLHFAALLWHFAVFSPAQYIFYISLTII